MNLVAACSHNLEVLNGIALKKLGPINAVLSLTHQSQKRRRKKKLFLIPICKILSE